MTPSHHIKQSRRRLKFAARDTADGDHAAAARSWPAPPATPRRRYASTGTTWATCAHPPQPQSFLTDLAGKGYVKYSLTGVVRESYSLPDRIKDAPTTSASPNAAHREITHILRRTCIRARRLLNGIVKAMADELNPMTLEETISRV